MKPINEMIVQQGQMPVSLNYTNYEPVSIVEKMRE